MAKKKGAAQARRRSRELAVQVLYSMELRPGQDIDECLDTFTRYGAAVGADGDVLAYMTFLVGQVWRARSAIDGILLRIVTGWRPERMVAVDRAVLRVAVFEGFIKKDVPPAVVISEAVDIARAFGTEDSGRFVNGVLAKVLRFMEDEGTGDKKTDEDAHNAERCAAEAAEDPPDS